MASAINDVNARQCPIETLCGCQIRQSAHHTAAIEARRGETFGAAGWVLDPQKRSQQHSHEMAGRLWRKKFDRCIVHEKSCSAESELAWKENPGKSGLVYRPAHRASSESRRAAREKDGQEWWLGK